MKILDNSLLQMGGGLYISKFTIDSVPKMFLLPFALK
jgi:hypothetical protein